MTVHLDVLSPTKTVICHAHELLLSSALVSLADGVQLRATSITYDTRDCSQTVCLTFPALLPRGEAQLTLAFTGLLNDKMAGFYRSSYVAANGETRPMGVTQFEATDARRAFPCWDEPALKATFAVTLRVPADLTALGNMPPVATALCSATGGPPGLKDVTFDTSPLMSTYLVAFCVGEFDVVEETTAGGVVVRVWTPPGLGEQGRFALAVGVAALDYFATFFSQPYPLPKLDMVAVADFAAGAMENWGLVTYRTVLALYDPAATGAAVKQQIAYVVCHELAHQARGQCISIPLLSHASAVVRQPGDDAGEQAPQPGGPGGGLTPPPLPQWWSELWLNEGFATWVGWAAVDQQFPEWRVWEQFLVNEQARGLELDALLSSHPVQVELADASRVNEIFDAISYAKGASCIHMLVAYLGLPAFQAGMRLYIARHAWGNATTADLWAALGEASGKPVAQLMGCWTTQTGFPVVSCARDADVLRLRQTRFLSTGADTSGDPTQWLVPLRVSSSVAPSSAANNPAWDALLGGAQGSAPLPPGATWAKINAGSAGFYRTAYDAPMAAVLARAAASLPTADRVGLVGDAFALAAAGLGPTSAALALMERLGGAQESEYVVWATGMAGLTALQSVFYEQPPAARAALDAFLRRLYGALAARLGWAASEGETHLVALLRALALAKAATLGDPQALQEARTRFAAFAAGDGAALPPDLRAGVFKAVVANGGRAEFEALLAIHAKAEAQELRVAALSALGASPDAALVRRALEMNLHSGAVRSQDLGYVVGSSAANPHGRRVAWDYLQAQWGEISARLDGGGFLLTRLVALSTASLASEADAADVEAFFATRGAASTERTVAQSAEKIRAAAAWLGRDAAGVAAWLSAQGFRD